MQRCPLATGQMNKQGADEIDLTQYMPEHATRQEEQEADTSKPVLQKLYPDGCKFVVCNTEVDKPY